MKRVCVAVVMLAVLGACAGGTYTPIVDQRSIRDQAQYQRDLAECQAYAAQIDPAGNAVAGAVGGAAVGAALGAIVGAFFGVAGDAAALGAAIGGAQGTMAGAGGSLQAQRDIVIRCMQGRGYAVLY